VTKLARALLTMNDYIHENPERLQILANIAAFASPDTINAAADHLITRSTAIADYPNQARTP
jgi:hypothetical protein